MGVDGTLLELALLAPVFPSQLDALFVEVFLPWEFVMGALIWVFFGVAAGSVAKLVMDGPRAGGIPMGILLGVIAAVLGGTLASLATDGFSTAIEVRSMLAAASAAIVAMLCYRAFALRCAE